MNAVDVAGNTALHHCVCVDPDGPQDMSEFFRFIGLTLIESYGADANARNCGGRQVDKLLGFGQSLIIRNLTV